MVGSMICAIVMGAPYAVTGIEELVLLIKNQVCCLY